MRDKILVLLNRLWVWLKDLILWRHWLYLATDPSGHTFNCRGLAPKSSIEGFARQMSRHGLQVRIVKFYRGKQLKET